MNTPDHLTPTAEKHRARDRARKRRERARRRGAKLVEIRLTATVTLQTRLFEILEQEGLTMLRSPRRVMAFARPTSAKPVSNHAADAGMVDLAPNVDASKPARPARGRKRPVIQPVADSAQLGFDF